MKKRTEYVIIKLYIYARVSRGILKGNLMSRFTNKLCPVCRAPFTEEADVVVCPVCGTPHHRVCYMKGGKCALEELHAQGFTWNGRLPDEPAPSVPHEEPDPHHAEYPQGVPQMTEVILDEDADVQDFFAGLMKKFSDEKRGEDGVSMKELCAYTSKSVMHYGRAFMAFRGNGGHGSVVSVNICAGLFAPLFQFYRRMDGIGVLVMLVLIILSTPVYLVNMGAFTAAQIAQYHIPAICTVCNILSFVVMMLLCAFSDRLYYNHCVKRIKKLRGRWGEECGDEYYSRLGEAGRPSWLRAIIGGLLTALCMACLMFLPSALSG